MRQNAISIVVPVFDEAPNLRALYRALCDALDPVEDLSVEFVLVDDGSRDASWDVITQLNNHDPRVKGVRLSRNFGHQAAVTAGYRFATGDAVIAMDADLQHPPELLPEMINRWRRGFDVVSMVRLPSKKEGWFKRITSRTFYRFINALSDVKIKDGVADFRLLDRRVIRKLNSMKERGRFLRGMISWTGFSETEIPYTPAERFAGHTKYTLGKMVNLAITAISSFSTAPLRLAFYAGLAISGLCVLGMGYAVYNRIYEHKDLTEWASTFLTMLFLAGMQFLMIGVIGIYVGRIFEEVKQRPVFIAEEKLGFSSRRRRAAEHPIAVITSLHK